MSLFPLPTTVLRSTRTLANGIWTKASTPIVVQMDIQPATVQNGGQGIMSQEPGRFDKGLVVIYTSVALVAPLEGSTAAPDVVQWQGSLWEIVQQELHQGQLIRHNKYFAEYKGQIV
jgi:hypothetical protein